MTCERLFSPDLWRVLTSSGPSRDAVGDIYRIGGGPSACVRHLEALQSAAAPATDAQIKSILWLLSGVFGVPWATAEATKQGVAIYIPIWSAYPFAALSDGTVAYLNRPTRFFPKPGEIATLAEPTRTKIAAAAYRAKLIAEKARNRYGR